MIYTIVNPSDPVTIEADDKKVAIMAAMLLGQGLYGLKDENDELVMPILRFLGEEGTKEFLNETFGGKDETATGAFIKEHTREIGECFMSAFIGDIDKKRVFNNLTAEISKTEKQTKIIEHCKDAHGSLNDICAHSHRCGEVYLKIPTKEEKKNGIHHEDSASCAED